MTGSVLLPGARERGITFGEDYERHRSGLWVPEGGDGVPIPERQPIGVDLFAGAGGFSCGFKQAGWHVAAASEGWATAAITYLLNLGDRHTVVHLVGDELPEGRKREREWFRARAGETVHVDELFEVCRSKKGRKSDPVDFSKSGAGSGWISSQAGIQPCEHFYLGDVRALTGEQILNDLDAESNDIGCVFGGPPCQGFSVAGEQDPNDPRNELVFEFMRVVIEVRPQAFCMENVPGIVNMVTKEGIPVLDALAMVAEEGGMGTFEAIRRALAESAGAGIALRGREKPSRSEREREWRAEAEEVEAMSPTLFDEVPASEVAA